MESKIKKSLNVKIDRILIERVRDIVYFTPGMTINDFVEIALIKIIPEYNNIPQRDHNLKPGRKIK